MHWALLLLFAAMAAGGSLLLWRRHGMAGMKKLVRLRFPDVPQIQPAQLAGWLEDPRRAAPLLLDVRTEPEYRLSHLRNALRVEPGSTADEVISTLPPGRAIVAYCSVGYRSCALAQQLLQAGVPNVFNLEGSIFSWAREGGELRASDRPTDQVHPYNSIFAQLLPRKFRTGIPPVVK